MSTPGPILKCGTTCIMISLVLVLLTGCNHFTYRPHTAKQKYFARPQIQYLDLVVRYRESFGFWPASLVILRKTAPANEKIIDNFQYAWVDFKAKDDDRMTMRFAQYKKLPYMANPDKIDLNAFHGKVYFFKANGKFAWKVKMK